MRDETRDQRHEFDGRPAPAAGERRATRPPGATVSIPPRTRPATPFDPTTLHAKLALLRPQPVRLRPDPENDK